MRTKAVLIGLMLLGTFVAAAATPATAVDAKTMNGGTCNGAYDTNCTCPEQGVKTFCKAGEQCSVWVVVACVVGMLGLN